MNEVTFQERYGLPLSLSDNPLPLIGVLDSSTDALDAGRSSWELIDAVANPRGEIALLDEAFGIVRLLKGNTQTAVGGYGRGPGKLTDPLAVAFFGKDTILVADGTWTVHVFGRGSDGFDFREEIKLAFEPEDICVSNGGIFVFGLLPRDPESESGDSRLRTETVHEIDRQGRILRSFSAPYHTDDPLVLEALGRGKLYCDDGSKKLWVAYSKLGEVHGFDLNGHLNWITRIRDFEPLPLLSTRTRIGPVQGETEVIETLSHISVPSAAALTVQVESISFSSKAVSRRLYFLEPTTGEGIGATRGLWILGGGYGTTVAYQATPEPRVLTFSLEAEG